jgi:hypothetical protein
VGYAVIVDPDFLEHWRTRMLVDALDGDEFAPFYLLRLWAHCQTRKATRFDIPAAGVKGLCKAPHDAARFEAVLIECGYLSRDGAYVEVLKWAEQNASLIAAWENGGKGGRPSKPNQNPRVQDGKPKGNPAETQPEPRANPDETDKRRGDKRGSPSSEGEGEQRSTRLPKPFTLPDEWRAFCQADRPELDPDQVAAKFSDHWHAKPGTAGRKLDWLATWRNWVRDERGPPRSSFQSRAPAPGKYAAAARTIFGQQPPDYIDAETN